MTRKSKMIFYLPVIYMVLYLKRIKLTSEFVFTMEGLLVGE
jgi:hypothetical protein